MSSSHKNVKLTDKSRTAAAASILRVANERVANNIAPIIAEIRAGGATSLQDIAAGLNQRGITTARWRDLVGKTSRARFGEKPVTK